jgi:hypothetical protein
MDFDAAHDRQEDRLEAENDRRNRHLARMLRARVARRWMRRVRARRSASHRGVDALRREMPGPPPSTRESPAVGTAADMTTDTD